MAAMRSGMAVICAVLALVAAACTAARTAPAPAADCSSLVLTMADCLTFVMAGSTTKKPEGTCCSGLKSVLKSNAECLCEAFRNSAQLGVTLNVTKAMTLPAACHVSAPSVSNCGLSTGAGDAPALPPSSAVSPSPSSVAEPPSSGSAGVNEVFVPAPAPAAASTVSGASSLMASMTMLVLAAAAAAASFSLF